MSLKRGIIMATNSFVELAVLYLCAILVCALAFAVAEDREFGDALWWAFVTSTTTGYGDISPVTFWGRAVGVFLMHFSIFLLAPLIIAKVAAELISNRDAFTHEEQEALKQELAALRSDLAAMRQPRP
jgi:voltage-gated potassium channel Kch